MDIIYLVTINFGPAEEQPFTFFRVDFYRFMMGVVVGREEGDNVRIYNIAPNEDDNDDDELTRKRDEQEVN